MAKKTRGAWAAALVMGLCLGWVQTARAVTYQDEATGILNWPHVTVDTNDGVTTLIEVGNVGNFVCQGNTAVDCVTDGDCGVQGPCVRRSVQKQAYCFYVNANGHCENNPSQPCQENDDCTASVCIPGWQEIDFVFNITAEQPLAWYAHEGLQRGDFPVEGPGKCSNNPARDCFSPADCGGAACNISGPFNRGNNLGSGIPPVPEDPFVGSLTCIQFDPTQNPPVPDTTSLRNSLIGSATIIEDFGTDVGVDPARYNAVGFKATGVSSGSLSELQIGGGAGAEYESCAQTLILDHLFDLASDPIQVGSGDTTSVFSQLTLVPCGNDFLRQDPGRVTAQFLVFNEFEQRFSTSETVECFLSTSLCAIDSRQCERSIFSAFVSGTIAGQTRIRGVGDEATGRGLIGVARFATFNVTDVELASSAYGLHQQGNPPDGTPPDVITIP